MAQKKKKTAGLVCGLILAVGILVCVVGVLLTRYGKKTETGRKAFVTEVKGTVTIQKVRNGSTNACNGMELESGDIIVTGDNAGITLLLDEDKHVILDENTKLLLQISGTKDAGKTSLYLEYGAVLSDIDEPLSPDSAYEVVTESSTMSVRGTRFEVVYRERRDETGAYAGMETKVLTYSGAVYVEPEGTEVPRMSRNGTMEVLTETGKGQYEFYGATRAIGANDLGSYSAEYLKKEFEENNDVLSEEEREQQEYLLGEIKEYTETILPGKMERPGTADTILTPSPSPSPTPSPSPSPTPSPSPSPTPSPSPSLTPSPSPSPTPSPSPSPTPSPSPSPTPSPSPSPTPSPSPSPTPSPSPSPSPTPTLSEQQETLKVRYYIPMVMRDLDSLVAGDVFDVMSQLSAYEHPENGTTTENAYLNMPAGDVLMNTASAYVNGGRVLDSAVKAYGTGTTVICNGFYDTKGNFYRTSEAKSFGDYGYAAGDTVELYAAYTVYGPGGNYSYVPCKLKADIKVLFISYKKNYMMGMPVGETVSLPEVDGFSLSWSYGPNQSGDSIRIDGNGINAAHLVVKMK